MNCREFIGFLVEYLDGELQASVLADFEEHLSLCESCTAYLASYRETILAARLVSNEVLLNEAPEELIEAILQSRPR
jgi:anti-sigma factor RsiW